MDESTTESILGHLREVYRLTQDQVVRSAVHSLADLVRMRAEVGELDGQPETEPAA
jgi:hypothetical protein